MTIGKILSKLLKKHKNPVKAKDLQTEKSITTNNSNNVREALLQSNIIPENLAAEEDIKKVERRIKSQTKKSLQKK
jgi:DNA-damage-inducible protein D